LAKESVQSLDLPRLTTYLLAKAGGWSYAEKSIIIPSNNLQTARVIY
jgi:hypothetical protein